MYKLNREEDGEYGKIEGIAEECWDVVDSSMVNRTCGQGALEVRHRGLRHFDRLQGLERAEERDKNEIENQGSITRDEKDN